MAALSLVISAAAQNDLMRVHQYSVLNWGALRAASYQEHIKERLWQLTEHPEMGANREDLLSFIRSLPVKSHVIYYRLHEQQIQIVRVLHARQDPDLHINY